MMCPSDVRSIHRSVSGGSHSHSVGVTAARQWVVRAYQCFIALLLLSTVTRTHWHRLGLGPSGLLVLPATGTGTVAFEVLAHAVVASPDARSSNTNRSSFVASGHWVPSDNPEEDCHKHLLCTPSNRTWKAKTAEGTPLRFYDHNNGCAGLLSKGITKIYFHGDSFMRQIYQGLLITLSGNYRNGSLVQNEATAQCEYHKQFNEKKCGVRLLNHAGWVCGGRVLLDPLLNGVDSLKHCSTTEKHVLLWSFGNYKTGRGHGRHGVNNATAYSELFMNGPCPHIVKGASEYPLCQVHWVSTHYRIKGHFPDEQPEVIQAYNEGMRAFVESGQCGAVHYIDVYNMTRALMTQDSGLMASEASQMTYDSVHWGIEVNAVKAQIILNALLGPGR